MSRDRDDDQPDFFFGSIGFSPEEFHKLIEELSANWPEDEKDESGLSEEDPVVAQTLQEIRAMGQAFEGFWEFIRHRPVSLFLQTPFLQLMSTLEHLEILLEGDTDEVPVEFLMHRQQLIDFLRSGQSS